MDLVPGLADAGKVGHRQKIGLSLDGCDYLFGECLGDAASAVGDGDEIGIEGGESAYSPEYGGNALPRPGREELEGEGAFPLQDVGNLYVGPPSQHTSWCAGYILALAGVGGERLGVNVRQRLTRRALAAYICWHAIADSGHSEGPNGTTSYDVQGAEPGVAGTGARGAGEG